MRTSDVKAKIVAAVEGVTPDAKASARDVFRHIDSAGRFGVQQGQGRFSDRVFHVSLASIPVRADMLTVDAYHVDYMISVFYTAGQAQIEDRIGQDAERIEWAMATVHSTDEDLYNVTLTPGGVDEFEQVIEARLTARATYRLTGVS